ncbi:MAG: hypothetical protein HYX68_01685, partial [Planctomycetes bacterium]|nr:hypothetical protein [Planctomycetota bacterium]
ISGAGSVDEGALYTLNLSSSDPGADTIQSWSINWGDGNTETVSGNPASVTHTYADGPASYTITATATDEDGTYSANTVGVSVNNVAPSLAISGAGSVDEGALYTLNLSSSDPGADTIQSWSINWGDGNTETVSGNPSSATHTYADGNNSYTISATATDEDGAYSANTVGVSVNALNQTEGYVRLTSAGVLDIVGTGLRDMVHVYLDAENRVHVEARFGMPDGSTTGDEDDSDDAPTADNFMVHYVVPADSVQSILIQGLAGADFLKVHNNVRIPAIIDGGAGNDAIWGGAGLTAITDLAGDSRIHAGPGNGTVIVGNGNNRIWTDGGTDSITAGDGNNEIHTGGAFDTVTLGNGNNKIWLNSGADVLNAGNGNNIIYGGNGNDVITVGNGNNTINGGAGNDTILTGNGNNTIDGGSGDDFIRAGTGKDVIRGGAGSDVLIGGAGADALSGGEGRDLLIGGLGADKIYGDSQDDLLVAGYTLFDNDIAALSAVMTEWTSNRSYADRVMNLMGVGGNSVVTDNGVTLSRTTAFSDRANGGTFLSGADVVGVASQTVFSDSSVDQLTGNQGSDWFLANTVNDSTGDVKDVILDAARGEVLADIDLNSM